MREYNIGDVELLEGIFIKMRPFISNIPNMANMGDKMGCPKCGSKKLAKKFSVFASGAGIPGAAPACETGRGRGGGGCGCGRTSCEDQACSDQQCNYSKRSCVHKVILLENWETGNIRTFSGGRLFHSILHRLLSVDNSLDQKACPSNNS